MIEVPVRVKDALRDGRRLKNYIFKVLNDDNSVDFVIDNDTLVKESVKIDERMCTGNQLKFGLCEGSSLEFQYFNHPNITGRQIQAFIDVQYRDGNGDLQWYEIPMGFFTVDQCPMQFSTGIRKVTAYNKLKSAYLDEKANAEIIEAFSFTNTVYITDIIDNLLDGFAIDKPYNKVTPTPTIPYISANSQKSSTYTYKTLTGDLGIFGPYILVSGSVPITTSTPIGLTTQAYLKLYNSLNGLPIRISLPDYLDELDDRIKNFYIGELDKISASVSTDVLWERIRNLKGDPNSPTYDRYVTNYFFSFTIIYEDDTVEVYGNNALDSKGSFSDLSKMTFQNVKRAYMLIPGAIGFYTSANEGISGYDFTSNNPICYGGQQNYLYSDDFVYRIVAHYDPPKLPNGQTWTPWDVLSEVSLNEITGGLSDADFIEVSPTALSDVTLRDLQSAVYELSCQYGKLDRETDLFAGIELNNSRLLPADTLYPANNLYPVGDSLRSDASMYQKLWTDSQGVQTFRYLIITYKGLDENNQEVEKILQRTVNADGTTDYNMSDNWLFKNLVWTDEDVGDYADAMVLKMQNVSWFPFEMWCAGLPYIETGDELEISNSEGTYTSYVLQRQLNGIQNLQDTYINGELDIF